MRLDDPSWLNGLAIVLTPLLVLVTLILLPLMTNPLFLHCLFILSLASLPFILLSFASLSFASFPFASLPLLASLVTPFLASLPFHPVPRLVVFSLYFLPHWMTPVDRVPGNWGSPVQDHRIFAKVGPERWHI